MKYVSYVILVLASLFFMSYHNVSVNVTSEDRLYIYELFDEIGVDYNDMIHGSFDDELQFIMDVQKKILLFNTSFSGIEIGLEREPKDFFEKRIGQCYDLSRTLEKIYALSGFEVRHLFVFEKKGNFPLLDLFFKKGAPSHAILQVRTSRGWVTVDSSYPWVSVTYDRHVVPIYQVKKSLHKDLCWARSEPHYIFDSDVYVIYGLYSRHGGFYPPFNFIPDINYLDFIYYNIMEAV